MNKKKQYIEEELQKAQKFINSIETDSNLLIIAHSDGDGIISSAIITKLLQEKNKERTNHKFIQSRGKEAEEKILKQIHKHGSNTIILLDYTPNREQTYGKINQQGAKTLTIDHHPCKEPSEAKEDTEKHTYVNPQKQGTPPAASVLCHLLYQQMNGEKNTKPWAIIGAHSDTRIKQSIPLLDLTNEEKELYIPNGRMNRSLHEISSVLLAPYLKKELAPRVHKYIKESIEKENPVLIQEEKYGRTLELYKIKEKAEKQKIKQTKKNPDLEVHEEAKLVTVPIESKLRIKSEIADQLRLKYPEYVIAVKMENHEKCLLSLRSSRADLSKAVPKACEGINGEGGGHPHAAGAAINKQHYQEFIKNLKKELKKQRRSK